MKNKKISLTYREALFYIVTCFVTFVFLLAGLQEVMLSPSLSPAISESVVDATGNMMFLYIGVALLFMVLMGYAVYYILVNRKE